LDGSSESDKFDGQLAKFFLKLIRQIPDDHGNDQPGNVGEGDSIEIWGYFPICNYSSVNKTNISS
jgi:hypothetical protein